MSGKKSIPAQLKSLPVQKPAEFIQQPVNVVPRMSIPSEQNKTWDLMGFNGIYIMGLTNSRIPELLLFSTASNCSTAHYVVDMMMT